MVMLAHKNQLFMLSDVVGTNSSGFYPTGCAHLGEPLLRCENVEGKLDVLSDDTDIGISWNLNLITADSSVTMTNAKRPW